MKINTSRFDYKVLDFFNVTPSRSVCIYFWQAFFAIGIPLMLIVGFFTVPIAMYFGLVMGVEPFSILGVMIISGVFSWCLVFLATVFALICSTLYAGDLLRKKCRKSNTWKKKEPSLIMEYIRAKKEKVCPTITFVNDED